VLLEVALRPVLRKPRRVTLQQLVSDPQIGDYSSAYCWALDEAEARAEKVRAAFTREAARDFYDLKALAGKGADFVSPSFRKLVDAKLAEIGAKPLAEQLPSFGLTPARRLRLESSLQKDLPSVVRLGEPQLSLDGIIERFDALWARP